MDFRFVGSRSLRFLKYAYFYFARIPIFRDGPDDRDSNPFVFMGIDGLHHLAEGTLS